MNINWETISKDYGWAAMDANGEWFLYSHKPVYNNRIWWGPHHYYIGGEPRDEFLNTIYETLAPHSLQERP